MTEAFKVGTQPRIQRQIEQPDLTRLFLNRLQQASANLNCISIGQIQDFDSDNQTATVQINYKRIIYNQNNPQNENVITDLFFDYPVLVSCPAVVLSGGDGRLTFPIRKGDNCVVLFNDRDMDSWFTSGQIGLPPNSDRVHDISDGIVLVGIRPLTGSIQDYTADAVELIHGNALIQVQDKVGVSIISEQAEIDVAEKVSITTGSSDNGNLASLFASLDALFNSLLTAVITDSTFNAATLTAIKAAQTEMRKVLE